MNITFACPNCEKTSRLPFDTGSTELICPFCQCQMPIPAGALNDQAMNEQIVQRCLVCPSTELYVRKAFSQRIGVTFIVIGLAASCITWYYGSWYGTYAILFVTALLDAVLYMFTGNLLQCYRCHSEYRDMPGLDQHSAFNLETFERHRQQTAQLKLKGPVNQVSGKPFAK